MKDSTKVIDKLLEEISLLRNELEICKNSNNNDLKNEINVYRTLIESSQDHIFVIDKDFRIKFINQRAANAFHGMPENLTGKSIR